jgi:Sugar kinases, ribokinase family
MEDAKPFLSVYGHVTIDQIITVKKFPAINESVDVITKKTTMGGTGTNIAVASAKLGTPTALSAFIGSDFPKMYEDEIKDSGVFLDELVKVEGYETSQAIVLNDQMLEQKVIFYQGPQGSASKLNIMLNKAAGRSSYVHFCTGDPEYYLSVMKTILGGPTVAVDPAQEIYKMWDKDKLDRTLPYSDFVFCNSYEAKVMEQYLGIKDVMDLDAGLIVRTEGVEGSTAKIKGEIMKIPVIKGEAFVDATGAGDTYRAGFYAGLYNGYDIRDSLILASAVSSFVVEKVGALTNIPTWDATVKRARKYL